MVIGEGKKSKIKNQKAKLQIKIQKSVSREKAQKTHRKVQPQRAQRKDRIYLKEIAVLDASPARFRLANVAVGWCERVVVGIFSLTGIVVLRLRSVQAWLRISTATQV